MTPRIAEIAPIRERRVTKTRHTAVRFRSRFLGFALVWVAACGGGGSKPRDTYARATDVQADCCEHLAGDARASCLQQVVKIDDPAVAQTSVNQQTYACVVQHFACDASTGRPTPQSAQAQLECIQDLGQ